LERKARGEPPLETAKSSTPAAGSGEVTPSAPETPAAPPVDKKDREFEEEEEEEEDEDDHTHSVRRYLQKTFFSKDLFSSLGLYFSSFHDNAVLAHLFSAWYPTIAHFAGNNSKLELF
jgi:hypothetical protein